MTIVSSKARDDESIELANNSDLLIRLDVVNQSSSITFASFSMLLDLRQLLLLFAARNGGCFPVES